MILLQLAYACTVLLWVYMSITMTFPPHYKKTITKDIRFTSVSCGSTAPSANLPGCLHCGSIISNGETIRLYGPAPHLLEWRQHVI